jgi:8-hydroxy-5-deazaflavin:NADPH oxidoreductase
MKIAVPRYRPGGQYHRQQTCATRACHHNGQAWLRSVGGKGEIGTFADAVAFGEIVFDCTNGANSIAVLRLAGAANLRGKILIQVGNPLDFSKGMPPSLTVCNTDSRGSSCPAFRR